MLENLKKSDEARVIGGIHCVGTEPEILECTHNSIGSHHCSGEEEYLDIIISCTSM